MATKESNSIIGTGIESDKSKDQVNLMYSQEGLALFPKYASYLTVTLKSEKEDFYSQWNNTCISINDKTNQSAQEAAVICGVDIELWNRWAIKHGFPELPSRLNYQELKQKPFAYSGGCLWFQIKSDDKKICDRILAELKNRFESISSSMRHTCAEKRMGGKVFGGQFRDAMINPVDSVNLSDRIIIGMEDEFYRGGSFVIQQKFKHNWSQLDDLDLIEKENMIGRNHHDAVIPDKDTRSHIKCVVQEDGQRVTDQILRQAMPYGASESGLGREEGIYFVGFGKNADVYHQLIRNIVGNQPGFVRDKMLNNSHAESGNFWFVPPKRLLGIETEPKDCRIPMNDYYNVRSNNGLMFYNNRDYLHKAQQVNEKSDCPISSKIMLLANQTFSQWNDSWQKEVVMPSLGKLLDYVREPKWQDYQEIAEGGSVVLRKGLAIKISLSDVLLRDKYRQKANLFCIKPHEIIVGNMPPLTLGTGTQVMEYLNEVEKIEGFFLTLNEYSATGHNVPNYQKVLRLGVGGLLNQAREYFDTADESKKDFYQSTILCLEGLQDFIRAYGRQARMLAKETPDSDYLLKKNYQNIATRMEKLSSEPPCTMLECLQLIFITNCALHQIGEPMSIGRLDQYLISYYQRDLSEGILTEEGAQEILDAFWLKMDQTVLYNRQHMQDYLTYGTGAVFYSAGNFPQGSALNQWVQQVTIGGYLATNDDIPKDGCNLITLMCLRSARRLPLNAPCLSLRVHQNMSSELHEKILLEASKAILSGGAHPILMNDDKLCAALKQSGPLTTADSRDYVCDGCYEPIIGGKSEWAFSYVPILPVVGMAMNQGATIGGSGWVHLRGMKVGWNSPPAEEIVSFEQFLDIFYTQFRWLINQFFNNLMNNYGSIANYCPSPLFSAMTEGCMESGKDLTDGGAIYHIVAPMMCGITDAINALYAINKLVYDPDTAQTTLPQLLQALYNNWGKNMKEPFQNEFAGRPRAEANAAKYQALRQSALALPKFGEGACAELKDFADSVVGRCVAIIHECIDNPIPSIKSGYDKIKQKYALEGRKFAFTVTPGVGTFEDNVGLGLTMGASADGRLDGDPIADDFCAAPGPSDQAPKTQPYDIYKSLADWNVDSINIGLSNAAPIDLNIREDFAVDDLLDVVKSFAKGEIGSNLITITTANPETYEQSQIYPEKYDLVRVRQGGWSEFYIAMFPEHQQYIARRPYYGLS